MRYLRCKIDARHAADERYDYLLKRASLMLSKITLKRIVAAYSIRRYNGLRNLVPSPGIRIDVLLVPEFFGKNRNILNYRVMYIRGAPIAASRPP